MSNPDRHKAEFLRAIIEDGLTNIPHLSQPIEPHGSASYEEELLQDFDTPASHMSQLDQFLEPNLKSVNTAPKSEMQKPAQLRVHSAVSSDSRQTQRPIDVSEQTSEQASRKRFKAPTSSDLKTSVSQKIQPQDVVSQQAVIEETSAHKTKSKKINKPKLPIQKINKNTNLSDLQHLTRGKNSNRPPHQSSHQVLPSQKPLTVESTTHSIREKNSEFEQKTSDFLPEKQSLPPFLSQPISQQVDTRRRYTKKPASQSNLTLKETKSRYHAKTGGVHIGRVNIAVQAKSESAKPAPPVIRKTSTPRNTSVTSDHAKRSYMNRF